MEKQKMSPELREELGTDWKKHSSEKKSLKKLLGEKLGIPFPFALSSGGWKEYKRYVKANHPVFHFVFETLLYEFLEVKVWWSITKPIKKLYWAIRHRTTDRMHIIDTGLKPDYYEIEDRMLHGMFNMLKDFVEVEKAWTYYVWNPDDRKGKEKLDKSMGIKYLDWEMGLTYEKQNEECGCPQDEKYKGPTPQAIAAKETKELYLWWTEIYKNRPDPWKDPRFDKLDDKKDIFDSINSPMSPERKQLYDDIEKTEAAYNKEDEEMMIRLVKLRKNLWT